MHQRAPSRLPIRVAFLLCVVALVCRNATADSPEPRTSVPPGRLGQDVNSFIGTGGVAYLCGNNFPGAAVPFGFARLSPDTISILKNRAMNSSGYYYGDSRILGFSHTRLVGTGATDGGNFLVIPCYAELAKVSRRGLNAELLHDRESAFPGYYGIDFPKLGIKAELTATPRVGVHRYTFSKSQSPHVIIHVTSVLGKGTCRDGEVQIRPESNEVEGSVTSFGTFSKRYGGLKTYFVAQFNRPIREFVTFSGEKEANSEACLRGDDVGVDLGFHVDESDPTVEVRLALSCVSVENARANLEQEAKPFSFDKLLGQAVSLWEEKLGRIQVTGGSERQRTIFRTALYRSFQMPTLFNDVNGEYLGFDKQTHQTDGFDYYTDMSLWDTFRTVHPLFNLIARREQRDMLQSMVKMAEQGGYLPRWPSGGGYTNSMFGTPADIMIAESWLKGIRDFDVDAAYRQMRKTALGPVPMGSPFSGRVGVEHYLQYGYCPSDLMKKSVASTIEYCYSDRAIADLAESLGHQDDAVLFKEHSGFYRTLFNPETQFFHPRDSKGWFIAAFEPEMLTYVDFTGKMTHAYVEGSAWQWRWGVPSDADNVVSLFKSWEYFVQELDRFFAQSPSEVGVNPNAYYWHGNQPDLYAAYLFNHAGRPDLTQKWVRWILETKYGDKENGLDGNDDGGTLSAWYVLSSLGLFPTAGTDRYEIGSPIWDRAELRIGDKTLTIVAENNAPNHPYVQKIWLNETLLDRYWLRHEEIAGGGTLKFEMAAQPASH
jgi:predicted alpha-1,2-mannosidase